MVLRGFRGKAVLVVAVGVVGCAKTSGDAAAAATASSAAVDSAGAAITADGLLQHIKDLVRRFDGRPRAGNAGRGQSRRLHAGAVQGDRPQAGESRRHVSAERRPDRLQGASRRRRSTARRQDDRAQVPRRLHRQLAPRSRRDEGRQLRHRLRRLRRRRAGVRLGRLQGRRRQGQDDPHARQRPGRCASPNDPRARHARCSRAAR